MVTALFDMARLSVEVMILLFGTLTLWLGFLRIAERAGLVDLLARALGPLFARLMPEVPRNHPALGLITLTSPPTCWAWTMPPPPSACAPCASCRRSTQRRHGPATRRSCSWC